MEQNLLYRITRPDFYPLIHANFHEFYNHLCRHLHLSPQVQVFAKIRG
jgi:hypothetical protein